MLKKGVGGIWERGGNSDETPRCLINVPACHFGILKNPVILSIPWCSTWRNWGTERDYLSRQDYVKLGAATKSLDVSICVFILYYSGS